MTIEPCLGPAACSPATSGEKRRASLRGKSLRPVRGYKETVRMNPGEVTTVMMKFDLPTGVPFVVPQSPRNGGHEYVRHCQILEHAEHDLMRPLVVKP